MKMEETNKKSYERWPACILKLSDISRGEYVKVNEDFSPDHIVVDNKKVSRVNVIGIVIDRELNDRFKTLNIDDGSSSITLRDFDNKNNFDEFNIGEIVKVIAKPRMFNEQIYLVVEIIKKLKDRKWIELRRIQLEKTSEHIVTEPEKTRKSNSVCNNKETNIIGTEEIIIDEPESTHENKIEKLISIIKNLDKSDGAEIEDVIAESKLDNCEDIIKNLIKEGEVFEIRPGRIKVL
ncbi:MAG: hypothetical protein ABIG89_00420 [Candidatus Woesearchaeota archaeon]